MFYPFDKLTGELQLLILKPALVRQVEVVQRNLINPKLIFGSPNKGAVA